MNQLRRVLHMIKFEHTVFSLPFALGGAWLAAKGLPPLMDFLWIILAGVFARNAAMAFNRVVDRHLDATNPRTEERELVTGAIHLSWAKSFVAANAILFVFSAWMLAPLCAWFAIPVLGVLLGYSYLKRWTLLCHFGLGLALACAPAGAWLAISKDFLPGWGLPLWIGGGVLFWVSGFDLLYSLQDLEHDRKEKLHSLPSLLGVRTARALSLLLHVIAVFLWWCFGARAGLGTFYWLGLTLVSFLLILEHTLVHRGGLKRIPVAFFQVNSWVGLAWFLGLLLDLHQTSAILGR